VRVLAIVHQRDAGPGVFAETIGDAGGELDEWTLAERRQPPADPLGYDAVMILGGAMNLVNGIGTLRNRMSDAHGRGGKMPVKPLPRHASLAVNTAGAIATFLVETYLERDRVP